MLKREKIFSRYLTILKPGIILPGSQPTDLWAPHSPVIFKTKIQFPTQPQAKASPRNSSSAGVYFSYPLNTISNTGLLKLMMEREFEFQITSHFCYSGQVNGSCLGNFTAFFMNQTKPGLIYTGDLTAISHGCWTACRVTQHRRESLCLIITSPHIHYQYPKKGFNKSLRNTAMAEDPNHVRYSNVNGNH